MKIKVCHFVNIITGKSDGVYAHLKMIFKHVDKDKFQQYLVFQGNPDIEAELTKLGVKVQVIKSLNKNFSIQCFTEFYSFIKSENIDIIQTHFLKPYSIAGLLNILLKKKMIFNYHGLFIENLYNTKLEKIIYRKIHNLINYLNVVNLAIVPSNASKKDLLNETSKFKDIKVYYNGYDNVLNGQIDPELTNYFVKLRESHFVIGIIARMDIQKRIDIALEIAKRTLIMNKDIYYVFMGDGDLEEEMLRKSEEMNLCKNVRMLGYVPNAKIYIKYFDLMLYTSEWEGFPLSIWEAMAAKVPIVSTNVGGIKEILENENCGMVYPSGNVNAGVKVIMDLFNDQGKRITMGNNGFIAIQDKYNSKLFADFFDNLYSSILSTTSQ